MNINFTQNLWAAKEWARVNATGDHYVTMVHEATNEEKWGPTGEQMETICRNYPRGGSVIMEELQWKLKSRDKAWRPCYKALLVIDYLARNVKDTYLAEICSLAPTLRSIAQSFYYTNPKGVDHGVSVRERAKNLADLLSDGLLLREERAKAAATKAKLAKGASDGGGPGMYHSGDRYGGYAGGGGGGGGYGSGGGYGAGDRYGGGSRSGGSYDPYPSNRRAPSPPVPRTKEEQERYDMELALRMQREEERRAGVSAEQLETMYAKKVQKRQERTEELKRYAGDADEELARRLQQEEEDRARREGRSLPTLRSDQQQQQSSPSQQAEPPKPATPQAQAPQPTTAAPEPKKDVLDDLFAPVPQPPQQPPQQPQQQPYGQGVVVGGGSADPFDSFLDNRVQQQQQWNSNPQQPQQSGGWAQPPPQQQQQQNPWGSQPQPSQQGNDPWGQPQQVQQSGNMNWSQPAQPQPQQHANDPWSQPQQQAQQGGQGQWGAFAQQSQQPNNDPWGQPQQQQQPQPQANGSSDAWGNYTSASGPSYPAANNNSNGSGIPAGAAPAGGNNAQDPMWAAFGQFNQQQQRKH